MAEQKSDGLILNTNLSALQQAQDIGDQTHVWGFDWPDAWGAVAKVAEEWQEVQDELEAQPIHQQRLESEIGDLLFSLTQMARHCGINAEQALLKCNQRFHLRFKTMLELSQLTDQQFQALSLQEQDDYYQLAKKKLKKQESD